MAIASAATSSFTCQPIKSSLSLSCLEIGWERIYTSTRIDITVVPHMFSVGFLLILCGIFRLIVPCSVFHFYMFGASQASISSLFCCCMYTEVQTGQEFSVYSLLPFSTYASSSLSFFPPWDFLYSFPAATASIDSAMQRNGVDLITGRWSDCMLWLIDFVLLG